MLVPMESHIARARTLVESAERIVVLTGAGISTDSGIPDFRGPSGVWTKDPEAEKLSTYEHYVNDPSVRMRAWEIRRTSPAWTAVPNDGHRSLVDLARSGRLSLLVTQNIDGLHQAAGLNPERIVEIHGNANEHLCISCGARGPMSDAVARVEAGDPDPHCEILVDGTQCGGIIKSATISFGQSLVVEDLERAESAAERCDLLVAIGSTLSVYPAAGVVPIAKDAGAAVIIINGSETALDSLADVIIRGDITEALVGICSGLTMED